jgi:hypothetical protein
MTAARQLADLIEALGREGTTVIDLVCGPQPVEAWRLYPGEYGVFDRRTRSQFYYHSHGAAHEAGHFHTVRLFADRTAHLVAISMAPDGWPQALFTVNLWAIGDAYESAAELKRYVRRFQLREHLGPAALVRFVNLVFAAFRPEIEQLQEEKIAVLAEHCAARRGQDVFADRSLEVLSRVEIDVRARAAGRVSTSTRS